MFGIRGPNHHNFGKTPSAESRALMNINRGTAIFVYDTQGSLVYNFSSANKAAEFFDCYHTTILKYARNSRIFKNKWRLSTFLVSKE
jgi:hypothetical protein